MEYNKPFGGFDPGTASSAPQKINALDHSSPSKTMFRQPSFVSLPLDEFFEWVLDNSTDSSPSKRVVRQPKLSLVPHPLDKFYEQVSTHMYAQESDTVDKTFVQWYFMLLLQPNKNTKNESCWC